jgi:single-stranded-DNA-specific exonuclease
MYPKINPQSLKQILEDRFEDGFLTLRDLPTPNSLKDMQKATLRIAQAIKNNQKIVLIGDYDVDGVVSTTLIKSFFDHIDYYIEWIIPNRFEDGYGLSPKILDRIDECDLIITVDNGISAYEAGEICQQRGIDLIITDHHLLPPKIPQAYAIINQKQPECTFKYDEVCGAQIAWYLVASLKNFLSIDINMIEYLEYTAIAIIADMMPLHHINRAMCIAGIKSLNQSTKPSIKAIFEKLDKDTITSEDIAFFVAPLLNSAGRMQDAKYSVEFLLSTNIYDARVRLERLIEFNDTRKEIEATITKEAIDKANLDDDVLVIGGKEWHEGVVGIVAARVGRHFDKPCIVLSENEEGTLKGSGRSFCECDLFEIVDECRDYLDKFGGHSAAIGLSLHRDNLDSFVSKIQDIYKTKDYQKSEFDSEIVGEIEFSDISFELLHLIKQYEPFGQGNPAVKFYSTDVEILLVESIGKDKNHLRFLLKQGETTFVALKFKSSEKFEINDKIHISYTINENPCRGETTLQLLLDKITIIYQ